MHVCAPVLRTLFVVWGRGRAAQPSRAKQLHGTVGFAGVDQARLINGQAAPYLSHWTAFQNTSPLDRLGRDGHPTRGGPG